MVKTVIKEFMIILLMCIAVVLVLGVIFYGYIPNDAIPSKIAYETPDAIKNELGQTEDGTTIERQNIVYEITDSDLTQYKADKNYNPGKVDPFAELGTYASTDGNITTSGGNTIGNSNNGSSTANKTGSSLFNDTSIK